jgi:hypothetical protein
MKDERWEVRIWAAPGDRAAAIAQDLSEKDAEYRTDTYLLTTEPRDLVKLRGGKRLEAKRLLRTEGGAEHWGLAWASGFPTEPHEVLGLGSTPLADPPAFRRRAGEAGLPLVEVRKHRRRYEAEGACVEVTAVMIGTARYDTLGIEADTLKSVRALAARYGLDRHPNLHYGAFLRSLQTNRVAGNSR